MAELVDALASGASFLMEVEVRVLFWAPLIPNSVAIWQHQRFTKSAGALMDFLSRSAHIEYSVSF